MSYEIMIPDAADLPAHIINTELAKQANEDAVSGVSTGFPPRIKMGGKQFILVDGNGAENPIPMGKLFKGPDDNLYLKTVVLRAKKDLQKRWYATKFDPSKDGVAPDCFSNDGQRPDASIPEPQCDTCAACPMNAFGSGKNENGAATAGKSCTDNKMLAVFLPNQGTHELKITPASLKNWGMYVKALTSRGIPVGNVFTLVGFVSEASFPVLTFQYGGAIPESGVEKLAALATSPEAEEIINQRITFSARTESAAGADTSAADAEKKAKADKAAKAKAAKDKKAKEEAAKKAAEAAADDDLGLGLDDAPASTQATPSEAAGDGELSDADIAAELGL